MPFSREEQLRQVQVARQSWEAANANQGRYYQRPVEKVRGLENATEVVWRVNPEEAKVGYYTQPALQGYEAWLQAFQALDGRLSTANHEALGRATAILSQLRKDADILYPMFKKEPSAKDLAQYTQQKMTELHATGETYMLTGYSGHFNITRIRQRSDGSYSHTLYDAGGETNVIAHERDRRGQSRNIANVIEEHPIKRGTDIGELILNETKQRNVKSDSSEYARLQRQIDRALDDRIIRAVEDYSQRRGNCTTRGQRILVDDLLRDEKVSARLRDFITNDERPPAKIAERLKEMEQFLRTPMPHGVRVDSDGFGWEDHQSSAYGESLRYSRKFRSQTEKDVFAKEMHGKGIAVEWGVNDGVSYAYIRKSNSASVAALEAHFGNSTSQLAQFARVNRGGIILGATGAITAMAMEAGNGPRASINAASEAILPGSTTSGNDTCKVTGTVVGGVAGTLAGAGAGGLTFGALGGPANPLAYYGAAGAGAVAYSVTQPVVKQGSEALCNAVLPDSVKRVAGDVIAALDSIVTFGGDEKVAQNTHKQVSAEYQGKQ